MRILLVLITFFYSGWTFANVNKSLELESVLEQRISRQIRPVDPDAIVFIRVNLKESNYALPGVSVDFFGSASVHQITSRDIESIEVRIVSSLKTFPEALKAEVEKGVQFKGIRTSLEIVKLDEKSASPIQYQSAILNSVDHMIDRMRILFLFGLGVSVAVLAALFYWFMAFFRSQVGQVVGAMGSRDAETDREVPISESTVTQTEKPEEQDNDIGLDLPTDGLVGLLADCYWSSQDAYARWIWDQMNSQQKSETLQSWPVLAEYARFLMKVSPQKMSDHQHPYYLKPMDIKFCSNEDLVRLMETEKGVWNHLPPLRREVLRIPLSQRLQLVADESPQVSAAKIAKLKSTPRKFSGVGNLGQLSIQDEEELWSNPGLVTEQMMAELPSLLWLARLNESDCKEILAQFSAADLARCWVGPEAVLEQLMSALPEKKRKLLGSYRSTISPNRNHPVMKSICRAVSERAAAEKSNHDRAA